jgi:hypothetical protein
MNNIDLAVTNEFASNYKPSQWLQDFDSYLNEASPLEGIKMGDYVVHAGFNGVAIYLGRESVDHIVLSYGTERKTFSTKANLNGLIRKASNDEIEASGLRGHAPQEIALYSEQISLVRRQKNAELARIEEQEIGRVVDNEVAIAYFRPAHALLISNIDDLVVQTQEG